MTPTEAITRLRAEVQATTGLTVSAGVSPNKTLSKIAADVNKPNGQFVIDPTREACMEFIQGVRLRKCFGIGRVCETLLNGIGLETVGDIFRDRAKLYLVVRLPLLSLFREIAAARVLIVDRATIPRRGTTSASRPTSASSWACISGWAEIASSAPRGATARRTALRRRSRRRVTLASSTTSCVVSFLTRRKRRYKHTLTRPSARLQIRRVAKSLAKDLKRADFSGRTVTLRIKHADFVSVTRAHTPGKNIYLRDYKDLVRIGLMLLHKEIDERPKLIARGEEVKGGRNPVLKARLLGLRVGNLRDERALAKANKLDGVRDGSLPPFPSRSLALSADTLPWRAHAGTQWVRVSSRSTPEIELSDSETDVQRDSDLDDDEDEDDDEADPGKRALNAVMRDAAIDPFADAGDGEGGVKKEDAACDPAAFGGASGSGSGSWMCVDDYDNDAEDEDAEVVRGRFGVHRGATVPKPSQRRAQQPSSSTIVQGSSLAAASRAGSPPKRKSPAAEDASANEKGKKRRIRKEEEEAAKPASGNEWTCRASLSLLSSGPSQADRVPPLQPCATRSLRAARRPCRVTSRSTLPTTSLRPGPRSRSRRSAGASAAAAWVGARCRARQRSRAKGGRGEVAARRGVGGCPFA